MLDEATPGSGLLTFPPLDGDRLIVPISVMDGDTIRFAWLIEDTARLYGINAPEVHSRDPNEKGRGLAAKQFLTAELSLGQTVRAKIHGRDKFGRALLELFPGGMAKSLNDLLIATGHALPWDGKGTKPI